MIHQNVKDFIAKISKSQPRFKVLGLDIGSKKIGVAFLDSSTMTPVPVSIINTKNLETEIKQLIEDYTPHGFVIGFPFGYDSNSTKNIEKIANRLVKHIHIDIFFVDEKLTTAEANSVLKDAGLNRKKRNEVDDMLSAKLILDNFIHQL